MFKFFKSVRWQTIVLSSAVMLCLPGFLSVAVAQQPSQTPSSQGQSGPRPKKQKLQVGAGFERYAGQNAASKMIAGGATRGPLQPIAPVEGLAFNNRPFFRWDAAPGIKSYLFELHDNTGTSDAIVYKTDVTSAQLIYPNDAPPLSPDKLYSWRVSIPGVLGTRKYGGSVSFSVLSSEDAKLIADALKKAGLVAPKTVQERLRAADVFKRYGIWYDALRSISEVLTESPEDASAKSFYDEMRKQLNLEQEQIKTAAKD
ncbi:MAG: hypothetical protein QOH25_1958 [Acidobacteriota bacterium]|jgi:hypothetical protein|nr:hypothetical protein [Acidobacteriota bacterium]